MNKLIRTKAKYNHFLRRVKLFSACSDKKWIDLIKEHYLQVYRNTGSPCNCYLCKSERYSKQDRVKEKELIRQELDNIA